MDFSRIDFEKFLEAALQDRFQGVSIADFEQFLIKLFKDNQYRVTEVGKSESMGGLLLLNKENINTLVHLKRYHPGHPVEMVDIHFAVEAARRLRMNQVMIVTTSEFSPAAKDLCKRSDIFMWDWEILKEAILKTYKTEEGWLFGSVEEEEESSDDYLEFSVKEVSPDSYKEENSTPLTKIILELHNHSGRKFQNFLDIPILIRHDQKQFAFESWMENSFVSGMIYKNAKVEVGFYFLEEHLPALQEGDSLLIPVSVPALSLLKTYQIPLLPEDERCFVVTYAFDRYSPAYWQAIHFRDDYLMKRNWGKFLVRIYYFASPAFIRFIRPFPRIKSGIRRILYRILKRLPPYK